MNPEPWTRSQKLDAAQPCVQFSEVEKTYDGVNLVVKRLDLSVQEGEFLTLLGPSGSGKTTTLMMLAGFEAPTAGSIILNGKPIERLPPHRRDIGVVFQSYALFPHMTIEENVYFPLRMRSVGRSEAKPRVARALDMVQMGGFANRKPAQLSGGQQQRIALARALVFEPRLILMDEPLGALDKQLREHMQLEIKQLHDDLGITVVYVTHDQSEALTMSDRVAVFNDGIIQQLAEPRTIYNRPATPFVAQFIGDNNLLAAKVVTSDAGHCTLRLPQWDNSAILIEAGPCRVKAGHDALLSVRPEKIKVSSQAKGPGSIPATVQQAIYHGDHIRLQVDAQGVRILVKMAEGDHGPGSLDVGGHVWLSWNPEDCQVFEGTH